WVKRHRRSPAPGADRVYGICGPGGACLLLDLNLRLTPQAEIYRRFAALLGSAFSYDRRRESRSLRSSPYGSLTTLGSLLRIIVERLVVSNAGHAGRPLCCGLPVRAKLLQAMLILS